MEVSEDNTIQLNITDLITQTIDVGDTNVNIPPLSDIIPPLFYELIDIESLRDVEVDDPTSPFYGQNLGTVLESGTTVGLEEALQIGGGFGVINIPLEDAFAIAINPALIPTKFTHNYTVIDTFTRSAGKFGSSLGNVALIDCKYAKSLLMTTYLQAWDNILTQTPVFFLFLGDVHA